MNALSLAKDQVFLFLFSLFSMLFLKEQNHHFTYVRTHSALGVTTIQNIIDVFYPLLQMKIFYPSLRKHSSHGAAKVFRWLCGPSNTTAILKSPQNTTSVFNSVIQCTKQNLSRFKKKKIQHSLNNKIIVPHGRRCWSMLQSDLSTRQHSGKKKKSSRESETLT